MQKRQKHFGAKYGNEKILQKKVEWINNMENEFRILEEVSKVEGNTPRCIEGNTKKKYQTGINV